MIATQRSDGFFNYPRSKLIAIRYLKSQDEGTLPCFFPLPRSDGVAGRVPPSLGLFFSRGATGVKVAEEPRTRSRQALRANMHSFIGCRICTTFVGRQLSTGGRPRKTPLFDYSSTVAKEKPQGQGLGRNDFRAPSKGQGAGRRTEMGGGREKEKERKRRQERSEIYSRTNGCKFI